MAMRGKMKWGLVVPLGMLVLSSAACCCAAENGVAGQNSSVAAKHLKILFIGNSLTFQNNLPAMLKFVAASATPQIDIDVDQVTFGGAKLEKHWSKGDAQKKIQQGGWDYVVLQDHSSMPVKDKDRESMFTHMRLFDAEIKKAGAKTILYMTWALQKTPEDQPAITQAYLDMGRELNAKVIPVGIARQNAAKADPTVALFVKDGKHPTPGATYMAACLFLTMLTEETPAVPNGQTVTLADPKNPKKMLMNLTAKEAEFFQHVAAETSRAPVASTTK